MKGYRGPPRQEVHSLTTKEREKKRNKQGWIQGEETNQKQNNKKIETEVHNLTQLEIQNVLK